jgi:hypothetical protein
VTVAGGVFLFRRSVPLPDGSSGAIVRYPGHYLIAHRDVGGLTVWGQAFSPTDKRGTPADIEARLDGIEARILADMAARPSSFDRRRVQCIVCGAASERGCAHQPAGFQPDRIPPEALA